MPDFPGRLRTPRLPSAPGTPAVGEIYYNTANNTLYWWNGSAWVTAGTPRVAALPGAPVDGQEIYYVADATNGVIWHLRYNAGSASAYKWELVGGSALLNENTTVGTMTTNVYADPTTGGVGPAVTLPLAGDYDISHGANMYQTTGGVGWMSYQIGATPAGNVDAISQSSLATGIYMTRTRRKTIATASSVITAKYLTTTNVLNISDRWLQARPVRVG